MFIVAEEDPEVGDGDITTMVGTFEAELLNKDTTEMQIVAVTISTIRCRIPKPLLFSSSKRDAYQGLLRPDK